MKKTIHFKQRQNYRKADDYLVMKTKMLGTRTLVNGYINYRWGTVLVVESPDGALITVHPGDHPEETPKILSSEEAKIINFKLTEKPKVERTKEVEEDEENIISLEDYLSGKWLKKTG